MHEFKQLKIISLILVAFNIFAYLLLPDDAEMLPYVSDLLTVFTSLISVFFLFRTYAFFKVFDFAKTAWLLFLIGMCLNFLAETFYALNELVLMRDMNEYFPSTADIFWCIAYLPLIAGFLIIGKGYRDSGLPLGNMKSYSLVVGGLLVIVALVSYFLLNPIVTDAETRLIEKVFYLYYPIADLVIVVLAISMYYIVYQLGKGDITLTWKLMIFGFLSITIADLLYSYLGWMERYGSGNLIDVAWNIGYLLIALSAVKQKQIMQLIAKGGNS
ncbi:MAG: hypothetical protein JXR22_12265 [Prolixibacteraceae bacterium]|nr:hypothetical protein [Prolixibacteraceae bacterium]